ncbi:HAMP domain-containing protein [Wenzhouxiangella sp. AB-CW3]|uniref:sensor histidine kinase n=1 Tax=Wenzhouxiangella sp. AB-CW3 TaxID=2771012 RepID=UPI00168BE06D|nr:ATP-binding protein [Wenzhouxiangella sp. AB-CW3]QOC22289.1 HAMP domain-containing protein [Wenzhouxiangella sp. AB-CW3]
MPSKRTWKRLLRAVPLAAVLVLLLSSLYLVSSVEQEATQLGRLAMWIIVLTGVSVLILLAVIVGRLVKLVQRLRAGEAGARLTARLVAVFVVLTLPPVVILYLFAMQFITDTIDGWMDVEAERALADSIELGQMFMDIRTREVRGQINRLADEIDLTDEDRLFGQLLRQVSSAGPTELAVLDTSGRTEVMVSIDAGRLVADRPNDFALVQALQNQEYAAAEPTEDGIQIRVLRRLVAPMLGGETLLLQALYPLPAGFSDLAGNIEEAYFRYQNVSFLRSRLQQSLILILSLVLLLTLLLAMLLAFNAARRLTQPIRELAEATEEIAAGRFPGDLAVKTRDELGFLVGSFNTMKRELATSRAELEAQRRYLEIVLGRLSAGVLAIDPAGRVSAFNDSAVSILGLDADRVRGQAVEAVRTSRPDLEPLFAVIAERHAAPGSEWRREIKLGTPDRPLVLVCRGSELPAETGGHVVVFDDVTVLDQAQRDAAWGEVARRLAHEVKNPLTPIQLAAERLAYKLEPGLPDEQRQLLTKATGTIRAQVDALKRLVDSFGDYARPSGLNLEAVNPVALVNEVVDLYTSGDMPVSFQVRADEDVGRIQADAGRLRQVLLNLVRNAQEAHPQDQPTIRITIRAQHRDEHDGVTICLHDDGPGFADEVLQRIFEPYVTTKPRGSGLGLAIVRRTIEEHGGQIEVANPEAGGAEVRLWLPRGGVH